MEEPYDRKIYRQPEQDDQDDYQHVVSFLNTAFNEQQWVSIIFEVFADTPAMLEPISKAGAPV
jgi:hypothetical protein